MLKSVLFVCLGNICRSPLAEGIAKKYILDKNYLIKVDSAGTSAYHIGESPHYYSIDVANKFGIDISMLKSSKVNIYKNYNFFVAMDRQNIADLIALGIDWRQIVKIGDYGLNGMDIPDPYYKGIEGFFEVFNLLNICVKDFLDWVDKQE